MNKNFLTLVKLMREYQKKFFKSAPGSADRRKYLKESKKYEKMVDQYIDEQESIQKDLF